MPFNSTIDRLNQGNLDLNLVLRTSFNSTIDRLNQNHYLMATRKQLFQFYHRSIESLISLTLSTIFSSFQFYHRSIESRP